MKKLIFCLVLFLFAGNIFAQWERLNGPYFSDSLSEIYSGSGNNYFVIGKKNLIFKSTDSGKTWVNKNQSIDTLIYGFNNFNQIKFLDSSTGFISSNYLFKTTDGGNNWFNPSPVQFDFYNILSYNIIYGVKIVNNKITLFVSNNSGVNWTQKDTLPPQLLKLGFRDNATGFAISTTKLYKTTNEGASWFVSYESTSGHWLKEFEFYGDNNILLATGQKLLKTTNSGINWIELLDAGNVYDANYKIGLFRNTDIVVTQGSTILYSTNGGNNFSAYILRFSLGSNMQPAFKNSDVGIIGSDVCRLILISNYNRTYDNVSSNNAIFENLRDIHIFDTEKVVVAGDSNLITTTNGGNSWNKQLGYSFKEIEFLNYNTGYGINSSQIFKTTDHGQTWNTIPNIYYYNPGPYTRSYSNLKLNPNGSVYLTFYVWYTGGSNICYSNMLYSTTNDGANWNSIFSGGGSATHYGSSDSWFPDYTFNNQTAYVINNAYTYNSINPVNSSTCYIKKTSNGGSNWINVWFKDSCNIQNLFFLNENTGYFTMKGTINNPQYDGMYRTTNGGDNWLKLSSFTPARFQFTNYYTAYSIGYCSSDGGINWIHQFDPFSANQIKFANNLTGYIVGNNGFIYKTTNGGGIILGVNLISNVIPDKFSLSQNYPNPFNPSTVIRYQLSAAGFTTLKVFDLLGKEIASLVNEKQNAGSYAVDFNSSDFNLPSGIYFYTLNAEEFKETKKMVLIK